MARSSKDRFDREREVRGAFSPSAPIQRKDLFAGRIEQMLYVSEAITEPGQHAVIYGERGVGKTSLAAVSREVFDESLSVKINCQASDDFSAVWRKAFGAIRIVVTKHPIGFTGPAHDAVVSAADYFTGVDKITPDHVRVALEMLGEVQPVTVYLDEFDRLKGVAVRNLFADTIKTLSDQVVPATVVLVGVADDVDELVSEHRSIERALVQIHMPRMSRRELAAIVTTGLHTVAMRATQEATDRITALSQGLPHYTHLLAQHAAGIAAWADATEVRPNHVDAAVETALKKAQESLNDDYYRATRSNRENMYKQVVLACACARVDERGYFQPAAVREPLSRILGRSVGTQQFAPHLNALASDRGPILKKTGTATKFRYRFVKPIMQPYILMRGLTEDLIDHETLEELTASR